MGKPSAPPAPDYAAAATAQGQANTAAAAQSSKMSNPNINNPYGSQTVSYDANNIPTVTQTLSPTQQKLFDQNNQISQDYGNLAQSAMANVAQQGIGTPLDMTNIGSAPTAGQQGWDNAYNAIMQRNQPFMDRSNSQLQTQLANQGLAPDSEAYKNAMMDQAQNNNNFALGAQAQATDQQQAQFGMDTTAQQNALGQAITLRELPMNEANALRSGSQISVPQFQQFSGTQTAPAPIMQGAQNQYQAAQNTYGQQSANYNNMMSGLFSLGGAGLMAMG